MIPEFYSQGSEWPAQIERIVELRRSTRLDPAGHATTSIRRLSHAPGCDAARSPRTMA